MNGLEEIILAIKQKAEVECAGIKERAEKQAEEISAKAQKQAQIQSEDILKEADRQSERIIEAAHSAAVSAKAKEILKYKSAAVREVIDGVIKNLSEMPDEEYFAAMEKLILSNYHKNESGIISFCEKDTARISAEFIENINKKLAENKAKLELGKPAEIENGFILCYGDIEENCSFGAIINACEDTLKDSIAKILFAD